MQNAKNIKKLISQGTSGRRISCRKKKMRIVKNYIVAEEKVARVARFSSQHFHFATFSFRNNFCIQSMQNLMKELFPSHFLKNQN